MKHKAKGEAMKKNRGKEKLISGVATIWFMSIVTTNASPKMWQVALIGIGLYEIGQIAVSIAFQSVKARNRRKVDRIRKADAVRWAEEWFNPYKGVSA